MKTRRIALCLTVVLMVACLPLTSLAAEDHNIMLTAAPNGVILVTAAPDTVCNAYTDLNTNAWYHDGVHFCLENSIIDPSSETEFGLNDPMTRGSFAKAIYAIAKSNGQGFGDDWAFLLSYTDVYNIPEDQYEAVAWCTVNHIVEGYDEGAFGPNDTITREQMATILYRYVQYCGEGFTGSWMFLLPFDDAALIHDWANEAAHWCTMKKIIQGTDDNRFDPESLAKKCEAAVVLDRFVNGAEEEEQQPVEDEPVIVGDPTVDGRPIITGGWTINTEYTDPAMPDGAKAAFEKAMEGFTGVGYTPIAFLGSQVVAGVNYAYLCAATTVTAAPVTSLKIVKVYRDLSGNASITSIEDFSIAQ